MSSWNSNNAAKLRLLRTLRASWTGALFAGSVVTAPATADSVVAPPPERLIVSPGGVDMRSGRYVYNQTDLSIGGEAGLALTRTMNQQVVAHQNPFGNFSHDFDLMLTIKTVDSFHGMYRDTPGYPDTQAVVAFGGLSSTFLSIGSYTTYDLKSRAGYATLTYSSSNGRREDPTAVYTYQAGDGTTAVFRPIGRADCSSQFRCAYVSRLTHADGTQLDFKYDSLGSANTTRLRSVVSSRGYALLLEYGGTVVTKACVLNLASTPKPSNDLCPIGVSTATYTYDQYSQLASVTDPGGGVWGFINGPGSASGYIKPGQSAPWLTQQLGGAPVDDDGLGAIIVGSQSFADGQSYTYVWQYSPEVPDHVSPLAGGSFTDAQGNKTQVIFGFPILPGTGPGDPCQTSPCSPTHVNPDGSTSVVNQVTPGPVSVIDPLGRTTSYDYCDANAMANLPSAYHHRCMVAPLAVSATDPGGIKTYFTWDLVARNLMGSREVAKAGSGLADITRSASYYCTPATIRYCQKPLSTTDANGNTATYTYAPEHGGVLTETQPAVNGVSPQKRYTYAQRTAWIANGGGGYAASGPPIWVLAQMSSCNSGPSSGGGCANANDEVVTTYDYGPDTGAVGNTLLLRGLAVTAGGQTLRTCYAYDAQGNKISETKPRAGLASCL